jgi:hypothetical protein
VGASTKAVSKRGAAGRLDEAVRLRTARRPHEALDLFRSIVEDPHNGLDEQRLRFAAVSVLKCMSSLRDWPAVEAEARRLLARFPEDARLHNYLGQALLRQDRRADARGPLEQALALDPADVDARNLLRLLDGPAPMERRAARIRAWPFQMRKFARPAAMVRDYVLRGRPEDRFIGPGSVFMTLGSCFAGNLAGTLKAHGHKVSHEPIGEEVNSTFANRRLMDWIEAGPTDDITRTMEDAYGAAARDRLGRALRRANVFIMTLGVAPCLFHRQTGALGFFPGDLSTTSREHILADYEMRTTTVAENADNIRAILAAVDRLAASPPRIVLTVSPVSLSGTTEYESAVVADCISKSTLRLACDEILRERNDGRVVYWPSFEIVRWLGPHYAPANPPAFGAEDQNTHHVSQWLVDMVVSLFLETHSARATGDGSAAPGAQTL